MGPIWASHMGIVRVLQPDSMWDPYVLEWTSPYGNHMGPMPGDEQLLISHLSRGLEAVEVAACNLQCDIKAA